MLVVATESEFESESFDLYGDFRLEFLGNLLSGSLLEALPRGGYKLGGVKVDDGRRFFRDEVGFDGGCKGAAGGGVPPLSSGGEGGGE